MNPGWWALIGAAVLLVAVLLFEWRANQRMLREWAKTGEPPSPGPRALFLERVGEAHHRHAPQLYDQEPKR